MKLITNIVNVNQKYQRAKNRPLGYPADTDTYEDDESLLTTF